MVSVTSESVEYEVKGRYPYHGRIVVHDEQYIGYRARITISGSKPAQRASVSSLGAEPTGIPFVQSLPACQTEIHLPKRLEGVEHPIPAIVVVPQCRRFASFDEGLDILVAHRSGAIRIVIAALRESPKVAYARVRRPGIHLRGELKMDA